MCIRDRDGDELAEIVDQLRTVVVEESGNLCVKVWIQHGLFLQVGQLSQGVSIDAGRLNQLVDV